MSQYLNEHTSSIAICVLAVVLFTGCGYHSGFTDEKLEKRFREDETKFNQLVQMMKDDVVPLSTVTRESAFDDMGKPARISAERLANYQCLLSELQLNSVGRSATGWIYFATWNRSDIPYGGTNEFFVYAETPPPDRIVPSLDKLRTETDAFAFKKIADRWYLLVDNW